MESPEADPYPEEPLPFWNEFCYSERHRVGFFEALATPRRVREYYGLYASCVDGFRTLKEAAAARAAKG